MNSETAFPVILVLAAVAMILVFLMGASWSEQVDKLKEKISNMEKDRDLKRTAIEGLIARVEGLMKLNNRFNGDIQDLADRVAELKREKDELEEQFLAEHAEAVKQFGRAEDIQREARAIIGELISATNFDDTFWHDPGPYLDLKETCELRTNLLRRARAFLQSEPKCNPLASAATVNS